jgi:threonine dehydrogenase-like Zn-dependent dehydrogenase
MRAAALRDGAIVATDVPEPPPPADGQLQIAVDSCGICGSDLSLSKDAENFVRVAERGRFPLAVFDPVRPVVPGHEYAGTVSAVGPAVDGFSVGDRVTGIGVATDPVSGVPTIIGYSNEYPGGFAERITVDASFARHVPDGLSLEAASLAEPLHVGETHVQQSRIGAGEAALVIGAGTIGLGVIIGLAARGIAPIVVVEPSPRRRELASVLGAHAVVEPPRAGPVAALDGLVDGQRVVAYECSGRRGTLGFLAENLPFGSAIQVVASPFAEETFVPVIAQWHQLLINFGSGPVDDPYGRTLGRLADGLIDPELFITGRVGVADVARAFEDLRDPEAHIKILVRPGDA